MAENKKEWYVVNTYAGHENRVKDNLIRRVETMGLTENLFRVIVAEEKIITEDKNGKKKEKVQNLYKGYVFVEMIMTDETWYMVRNTPGVTGICGSSGGGTKPTPVPANEIESVLKRIGQVDEIMLSRYNVGDRVKVVNGPFNGMEGEIVSIDTETNIVTLSTVFFGRPTPLEVDFSVIEKI